MKENRKTLYSIVVGTVAGTLLAAGAAYYTLADHSPFGKKDHFPPSFSGRVVSLEDLNSKLKESYLSGYARDDLIEGVLDGRILNIDPVDLSGEPSVDLLDENGFVIKKINSRF
ncbi:hypothetical protein J4416_02490 [Candidatus Pacearchaeota archaeon]|nr:hypothetical protein [Candidatus Pacearchaeota archaeon]